jgi:hypothetical protein
MAIDNGGVQAKRGFEFETQSLLTYLLIRLLEGNENFSVTFEKQQDATIVYPPTSKRGEITELIQCKKRESALPDTDSSVAIQGWDPWFLGECAKGDLLKWLQSPTGTLPIVELLKTPSHRYTVLLHGDCQNTLQRFVPSGLGPNWRRSDHLTIVRSCPVEFAHIKDPDVKRDIGPEHVARRVRVIPMAYPKLLEAQSRTIMEHLGVRPDASYEVLQKLLRHIQEQQQSRDEINRQLNSADIRQFLLAATIGAGRWKPGIEVLQTSSALAGIGSNQATDFTILSEGRFWKNNYFKQAESALLDQHAVIITGPITSGKSTLCKYLMHRFSAIFPTSKTYYLDVRLGDLLPEELSYFKRHLSMPVLFVIDNEQYSAEAVATFARTFRSESTKAYLIVTSTHTYSRTQASRSGHPLDEFPSITIEDLANPAIQDLLEANLPSLKRLSPAQRNFIANAGELYGGKIGLTLVFAQCFQGEPARLPDDRVFDTDHARRAVRMWLENSLMLPHDVDFEARIVPLLLLASYGISIPTNYDPDCISKLCQIGILELLPTEQTTSDRTIARDMSFPAIIARQNRDRTEEIVSRYLQQHPHDLPAVSSTLITSPLSKAVLRNLVINPGFDLVAQLGQLFLSNRSGFNVALEAIRQATPDHARRLLRAMAAPSGQVSRSVEEAILELRGAEAVRATISMLDLLNQLDRQLVRLIFDNLVGRHHLKQKAHHIVDVLISNLALPSVALFDALSFVLAIRRCHFNLGNALFDSFVMGAAYKNKKAVLNSPVEQLSEIVRCASVLRRLNHKVFIQFAAEFLDQERIESALMRMINSNVAIDLLGDLRRIHPRLAIDVLWQLWKTRPAWFSQAIKQSPDIVAGVGVLRALGRVDRRVAINLSISHEDFVCQLAAQEINHHRLASAINVTRSLSPRLAREMAKRVNSDWLIERLNAEQHRIALVGRGLSDYAASWPSLASTVVDGLDLQALYNRISPRGFLYNFVFLTRGVLDAMPFEIAVGHEDPAEQLIKKLRENSSLVFRLEQSMNCNGRSARQTSDLREVAIAFALLTEIGIGTDLLFQLYGIPNSDNMLDRVQRWLKQGADIVGIRQFLYSMMLLSNQSFAREALDFLPQIIQNRQRAYRPRRHDLSRRTAPKDHKSPPQGMEIRDIAEIGDLLRLAAAIDEDSAAELAQEFDLDQLAASCARDRNLGRHVTLLHGLHAASRSACLSVVRKIYEEGSEEHPLIELLESCENSEHVLQLVRTLQLVAPPLAGQVLKLSVELGRERFIALLGVEANLQTASKWLRTVYPYPTILPLDFLNEIVELMRDMRSYDDRLLSSIEATLSLIDVNRISEARLYVGNILQASPQVAGLRSLMALIELILRLMRVDQVLNQSCLEAVLEHISPAHLQRLINVDDAPIMKGFVYYLFRHHVACSTTKYDQILDRTAKELLSRFGSSAVSPSSLIARMLLGEVRETLVGTARQLEPNDLVAFHPWQLGLTETVYSLAYPGSEPELFVNRSPWQEVNVEQREANLARRRRYFGEDVSNIKCALSLRSSWDLKYMGLSSGSINKITRERSALDHRNAVRLLFDQSVPLSELAKYPYYLKVLFDETVFARHRFEWSVRIVNEVHSRMFASN